MDTAITKGATIVPPDTSYYQQTETEQAVVRDVIKQFRISADDRNRSFNYFDGRNLIDYINDSVKRFTTNVDIREGLEDYSFYQDHHDSAESTLRMKNFVEGYWETLDRLRTKVFMFRHDKEFYEKARQGYSQMRIK